MSRSYTCQKNQNEGLISRDRFHELVSSCRDLVIFEFFRKLMKGSSRSMTKLFGKEFFMFSLYASELRFTLLDCSCIKVSSLRDFKVLLFFLGN